VSSATSSGRRSGPSSSEGGGEGSVSLLLLTGEPRLSAHLERRFERLPPIGEVFTVQASSAVPKQPVDLWIVPTGAPSAVASAPPKNVASKLSVHDLYIPGDDHPWGSGDLARLVESVVNGGGAGGSTRRPSDDDGVVLGSGSDDSVPAIRPAYWLHVRDLCDAVAELVRAKSLPSEMDACGRRLWTEAELRRELLILWSRFDAVRAADGMAFLEAASLDSAAVQTTVAVLPGVGGAADSPTSPIGDPSRPSRPDLSPLHEALLTVNDHGFHPLVPLRVGLMEMLAAVVEGAD